jgi:hypothetical protein
MASATEINMQSIPTAIEQAGYGAIAVNCVTPSGGRWANGDEPAVVAASGPTSLPRPIAMPYSRRRAHN